MPVLAYAATNKVKSPKVNKPLSPCGRGVGVRGRKSMVPSAFGLLPLIPTLLPQGEKGVQCGTAAAPPAKRKGAAPVARRRRLVSIPRQAGTGVIS
ncbi:protein of unknown function [Azospirillum lipoferum 4B]|uniref:Uncharacterized protein n=1 Tax=Azospirillum lipoferum (strain 4B) TaxID=862719 RepID=G7Z470_AZOL4|nr:protein of unknown function [Azospirillum lipoferum 4B]